MSEEKGVTRGSGVESAIRFYTDMLDHLLADPEFPRDEGEQARADYYRDLIRGSKKLFKETTGLDYDGGDDETLQA